MGVLELFTVFVLFGFIFMPECGGATVQFYREYNFEGDMYETTSTENCKNLPQNWLYVAGSVRTTNCIVVFKQKACDIDDEAFVVRSEENRLGLLNDKFREGDDDSVSYWVKSFRDCNHKERRLAIILEFSDDLGHYDVHYIYNLCSCKTLTAISKWEEKETYRLVTYGACVKFYTNWNCEGKPDEILWAVHEVWKADYGWRSIEPCDYTVFCQWLEAFVFNIQPLFNISNLEGTPEDVTTVESRQSFYNGGPAPVIDFYEYEITHVESSEFKLSKSLSDITSTTFDASIQGKFERSVPHVSNASVAIKSSFSKAWSKGSTNTTSTSKRVVHTSTFRFSKKITVPPCAEYQAYSVVKFAKNVEINYVIQLEIFGTDSEFNKLTSKEIRRGLEQKQQYSDGQLKFLVGHSREDGYNVIVETTAKFFADHGYNSIVVAKGKRIPSCLNDCGCTCSK